LARIEGHCRCGAVHWHLSADALPRTYACHCLDCQTWSGSAFSQQAIVPAERFGVTGEVARFDLTSADGQRVSNQFACPKCFTRLYNTNSARPGLVIVRAGTFERSNELAVAAHIWVRRKQPWVVLDPAVPAWPEGAPQGELYPLLGLPQPAGA